MTKKKASIADVADPHGLRLEWMDADSLDENPANWRRHPAEQLDALQGAISEVGWAGALLYNEATGRLIDGHGRKKISTGKQVPVLIGSWSVEDEMKILATLDPLAAMAEADAGALDAVLRGVETSDEALAAMLLQLGKDAKCDWAKEQQEIVEDEVPEPPVEPVTKPGDLWLLGVYWECDTCGKRYEHAEGIAMKERCPCG